MEEVRKIIREELARLMHENFSFDSKLLAQDFNKIKDSGLFNSVRIADGVIVLDGGQWRYYPERREISQQNEYSKGFFQTSDEAMKELKKISGRNYAYNIKIKVYESKEDGEEDWDDNIIYHDYEYILTPLKLKNSGEVIQEMGEEDPIKLSQDMIDSTELQVKGLEDELRYKEADARTSGLPRDMRDARVADAKLTKDRLEQTKKDLELAKRNQTSAVQFSQMQQSTDMQSGGDTQGQSQIQPQT